MPRSEREKTAHLLRRFGLGASEAELDYYVQGGYEAAVERLLADDLVDENFPFELTEFRSGRQNRLNAAGLVVWWTARMLCTHRPLREKMTLFWHDHFATSTAKVQSPLMMARQNETLRLHALGRFPDLLTAVAKDPAMVFWLDNQENVKGKPNENFAREVMELFTLGIGHYSESDVQEAARAFTGWSLQRRRNPEFSAASATFVFRSGVHDDGPKAVLGRQGNLTGEEVLALLVGLPRTAEYLTQKILEWFVAPNPDPAAIRKFAGVFSGANLDLKALLRAIMLSEEFVSDAAWRAVPKCPVDFVIPVLRQLGVGERMSISAQRTPGEPGRRFAAAAAASQAMKAMGMQLFFPPDVAGWEGGLGWVTSATMVERVRFGGRLFAGPLAAALVAPAGVGAEALVDRLQSIFDVPDPAVHRSDLVATADKALAEGKGAAPAASAVARLIFATPEFQFA